MALPIKHMQCSLGSPDCQQLYVRERPFGLPRPGARALLFLKAKGSPDEVQGCDLVLGPYHGLFHVAGRNLDHDAKPEKPSVTNTYLWPAAMVASLIAL